MSKHRRLHSWPYFIRLPIGLIGTAIAMIGGLSLMYGSIIVYAAYGIFAAIPTAIVSFTTILGGIRITVINLR